MSRLSNESLENYCIAGMRWKFGLEIESMHKNNKKISSENTWTTRFPTFSHLAAWWEFWSILLLAINYRQ